jgi:hypothetical protein
VGGAATPYTKDEAAGLRRMYVDIISGVPGERRENFEGIEQFENLEELIVGGYNFDHVDFSPLRKLRKLEKLEITANDPDLSLTLLPDLEGLAIEELVLEGHAICSLTGTDKMPPRLKRLEIKENTAAIDRLLPVSRLKYLAYLRIDCGGSAVELGDLSGARDLVHLELWRCGVVDFAGIQALSLLEDLVVIGCVPRNIEEAALLPRLRYVSLSVDDEGQDDRAEAFDFVRDLRNLRRLELLNFRENPRRFDMRLLLNLKDLEGLITEGFIIENFAVLDTLPKLEFVNVMGSEFYPEDSGRLERKDIEIIKHPPALFF